jgi:hypothetical protein
MVCLRHSCPHIIYFFPNPLLPLRLPTCGALSGSGGGLGDLVLAPVPLTAVPLTLGPPLGGSITARDSDWPRA